MNATLGHDQRFEFESDQIRLDIPSAGITTRDEAWRITALGPPVVCLAIILLPYVHLCMRWMCPHMALAFMST